MMCSGTIVQFKIPRVIINDTVNFGGNEAFLRSHGIEVIDAAHAPSIRADAGIHRGELLRYGTRI